MENIISWLKENLSEERFIHSISTAKTAKELARKYNVDDNKAELAGLLHDCAKEFSHEKMLEIIKNNNLDVNEDEIKSKKVLHAPVSAYFAKTFFKVTDEEILSAIRFHTIGKINMTTFEKIIFLADKIEPETRIEPYFEELRKELKRTDSLDETLLLCSKMTIKSLLDRDLRISFQSIDLYNNLLNQ
ncbi:MAG: bis(5'-nucleosyl)-tetraphosphatase (symmetrical) YqeK [Candidatus Gastranaerophilales bacterium]|nr:bis(5'-nucleosyl)-tetraphosphatase (symmetrical) YqeK [Candidatus Gastranaerophilales bacterium]